MTLISCDSERDNIDMICGELVVHKLYKNGTCLSCNKLISGNLQKGWFYFKDQNGSSINGDLEFIENKLKVEISNSNDAEFNGSYTIKIDTIEKGHQQNFMSITLRSKKNLIQFYKSVNID
ncbi:MAG: hypothetical protein EOP00_18260 [Pedobacter sp.]|nr:MAG: hypothetical protein EOP00_18260 [Pedobacter sp.]